MCVVMNNYTYTCTLLQILNNTFAVGSIIINNFRQWHSKTWDIVQGNFDLSLGCFIYYNYDVMIR